MKDRKEGERIWQYHLGIVDCSEMVGGDILDEQTDVANPIRGIDTTWDWVKKVVGLPLGGRERSRTKKIDEKRTVQPKRRNLPPHRQVIQKKEVTSLCIKS